VEVAGAVAVVTGGAAGIGRTLALALADAGASGVVVADLDGAGAERVAGEIGSHARGVGCDVADDDQVGGLIEAAEAAFGPVGLFCANAGVAIGDGLERDDAVWERALDVNVRAHIVAARQLVPRWLERGGGYFLATASAAGLLTQIGSAPYAVTKHAAVAFAEWLSVTYGDRGIGVSCLCPMGVNTAMLTTDDISVRAVTTAGAVLEPEQVAAAALDAIAAERFLVLPHPEVLTFFQRKASDYDRWIAGMRRLQGRLA
jgi:NAD(P)-dependent dehydrogenase (short-subunit alcohol dehydrogenase family)